MKLSQYENRKDISVLIAALSLPVLSYFWNTYDNTETFHWFTMITLLVLFTAIRDYFYNLQYLSCGLVQVGGLRFNIRNVISYERNKGAVRIVTLEAIHNLTLEEENGNNEALMEACLKEFDLAFKYRR